MSGDINVQTFSGKVNINNNLLVGTSHLFVDTVNNKVGITTTSPGANLEVNGNLHVVTDLTFGGTLTGDGSGLSNVNSDSGLWAGAGTGNVYLSTSTHNVGIGTSEPNKKLHIYTDTGEGNTQLHLESADRYSTIQMLDDTGAILFGNDRGAMRFITGYDTYLTGGSEAMRILGNGNVGIGTNDPGEKLHVNGNLRLGSSSNDTVDDDNNRYISTAGQLTIKANDSGLNASYVNIALQAGKTNPGQIIIGGGTLDQYKDIEFYTCGSSTERMRIHHNGNVGIGTTSPEYNLDVTGNLRVTTGIVDTSWCSGSWLQTCTTSPTVTIYSNNGGGPMSSVSHSGTNMGGNRGRFTAKKTGNYLISCCVIHAGRGGADASGSNLLIVFDANGNNWNGNNVIATYDEIIDLRVAPSVEEAYTFMCQVYMEVGHYFSFRVHSSGYIDNSAKMLCSAALVR